MHMMAMMEPIYRYIMKYALQKNHVVSYLFFSLDFDFILILRVFVRWESNQDFLYFKTLKLTGIPWHLYLDDNSEHFAHV